MTSPRPLHHGAIDNAACHNGCVTCIRMPTAIATISAPNDHCADPALASPRRRRSASACLRSRRWPAACAARAARCAILDLRHRRQWSARDRSSCTGPTDRLGTFVSAALGLRAPARSNPPLGTFTTSIAVFGSARDLGRDRLAPHALLVAQRQHDGADHGDEQDQARRLEVVDVLRVDDAAQRLGVVDLGRRRRDRRRGLGQRASAAPAGSRAPSPARPARCRRPAAPAARS